ncbi:RloB family protein [Achromobacter ruhlandii]|uniref:RloB domain-containing protein n=1 Tax=Achromobacter ruhlandii TaxID=72557 RepID=A0A2M9GUY9_9BURK|nr:RloB family protein [Achromobacter ruhlandii]PJM68411.1 hypothetical protein CV751_19480 [Achromobacter ruhlandii]CAB3905903.1 hypothetical protein LMG3328_04540 [Achromobacter ruhlandii]
MAARAADSFERGRSRYKPVPRVLVLCEDSKSSLSYLQDACKHFRVNPDVEIAHCGKTDPLGIVNVAIERKAKYEAVYCAIDKDRHKNFDDAVALVKNHPKIELVVSYPCFEYWYLLHYTYSRKPYSEKGKLSPADALMQDLRKFGEFKNYDKSGTGNFFSVLNGKKFETAKRHAALGLEEAKRDSNHNPSTRIHELLYELKQLSVLKPA